MWVSGWLGCLLLALRAYLAVDGGEGLEQARETVQGRAFWVTRDPSRPTKAWTQARDANEVRIRILVEVGLEDQLPAFVAAVGAVLDDDRGWKAAGRGFARVEDHEHFSVLLAKPRTVDRLCKPLRTAGVYSCGRNGRAVLNEARWRGGVSAWGEDLDGYRVYMINHEVGHLLGMPHRNCEEAGQPAAVMLQQSKGLQGCTANSWPLDFELERLRGRWAKD